MKKVFITGLTVLAVLGLANTSFAGGNGGAGGAGVGGTNYQAPSINIDVNNDIQKAVAIQNGQLLVCIPGLTVRNDVSTDVVTIINGAAADAAAAASGGSQGGGSHPGQYAYGGQVSGAGSAAADAAAAASHSINTEVISRVSGISAASTVNLNIDMSNVAILNSGKWGQ
jgi:hypothetical protein